MPCRRNLQACSRVRVLVETGCSRGRSALGAARSRDHAVAGDLRSRQMTLTYDPQSGTLQANTAEAVTTIIGLAS